MNYYIFIVTNQTKYGRSRSASETYSFLMSKKAWGFGKNTSYRTKIDSGDKVVYYQAGGYGQKFLGTAILSSGAYKDPSLKELFLDPSTYKVDLKKVVVWENPKPVEPLIDKLSFVKNKNFWGTYFQGGCRKISQADFETIVKSKPSLLSLKETPSLNYWVVRMGRGGKYVSKVMSKKIVALGWSKVSPLTKYRNFLYLRVDVERRYPDGAIAQTTGQLWRFLKEIKKGDLVLIPVPFERKIIISKIISDYFFKKEKSFDYPHRRSVKILKTISRDDCSQQLKFSLGGLLTVYSIKDHSEEIRTLIEGAPKSKLTKTHRTIYDAVINRLFELDPREFENFVHHILNIVGFESALTSYVGDKGVDVEGSLNAEGLAQVKLKVQVKRVHGSLGIGEVQRIRGTLSQDEHGCIITLSSFTKAAIEESEHGTRKPIVLIDGEMLVGLILSHYDEINDEYKKIIGVKPKKIPLEARFNF